MNNCELAYSNFMETLIKMGVVDDDFVADDEGKEFYFMRVIEFDFCDKWGNIHKLI